MIIINPHFEVKNRSINSKLDYNEEEFNETETMLFHVAMSQDRLKILFTVEWKDPNLAGREFQVVRHDHLYLDGMDQGQSYPIEGGGAGTISADPTIVQDLFKKNLDPYGIVLHTVTVHNLVSYESINFGFVDPLKLEELYDLVNEACIKVKESEARMI